MTAYWISPKGDSIMDGDPETTIPPEGWHTISKDEYDWAVATLFAAAVADNERSWPGEETAVSLIPHDERNGNRRER